MTASLQPTSSGPAGEGSGLRFGSGISAADTGVAGADTGGGGGAAAASDEDDELEPLDLEAAAAVKRELLSGEDWASAVIALRRGQEDILEHLLRESR